MGQYNNLDIKLSNSRLNKLKSGIKSGTAVTLNVSSNVVGNSYDETNFRNTHIIIHYYYELLHKF